MFDITEFRQRKQDIMQEFLHQFHMVCRNAAIEEAYKFVEGSSSRLDMLGTDILNTIRGTTY